MTILEFFGLGILLIIAITAIGPRMKYLLPILFLLVAGWAAWEYITYVMDN